MKGKPMDGGLIYTYTMETSKNSTLCHGAVEWIASQRAFLAKTLAAQARVREFMANARVSGVKSSAQLELFSQNSSLSKTPRSSKSGAVTSSSVNLWRSDIPGATESCQPLMLGRHISEKGGGCLLPTMTASDLLGSRTLPPGTSLTGKTPDDRKKRFVGLPNAMKILPTLTESMVTWADFMQAQFHSSKRPEYQGMKNMPTLCATDWKSPYSKAGYQKQMHKRFKPLRDTLVNTTGHCLTPAFAEWYMGFPINSTALGKRQRKRTQS